MSIYLYLALVLIVALLSTRLMKVLKLPNVTGYIIVGILIGPFVFGLCFNGFSFDNIKDGLIYSYIQQIGWVSNVVLGFIAFSIGTSFKLNILKSVGKKAIVITILEATFATLAVIAALTVLHFIFPDHIKWELVLTLGAIAAATAPAATLMVIKQYKAKGELVNTLLPVVALDDAAALILFAVLFQISSSLATNTGFSVYAMIVKPILEILISLAIGAVVGLLISFLNRFFKSRNNKLVLCILSVFAAVGFYYLFKNEYMGGFELSSLLMAMTSGSIFCNLAKDSSRTLDVLDRFTSPLYMLFFVLSGASLDLTLIFSNQGLLVLGVASVYIVFRVIGKYIGAYTGAASTHCEPKVKKYLGLTLIPQAGVAIGLATTASHSFPSPETGALILAVILTSTLVYELIGPLVSKFALTKAGEIEVESPTPPPSMETK